MGLFFFCFLATLVAFFRRTRRSVASFRRTRRLASDFIVPTIICCYAVKLWLDSFRPFFLSYPDQRSSFGYDNILKRCSPDQFGSLSTQFCGAYAVLSPTFWVCFGIVSRARVNACESMCRSQPEKGACSTFLRVMLPPTVPWLDILEGGWFWEGILYVFPSDSFLLGVYVRCFCRLYLCVMF